MNDEHGFKGLFRPKILIKGEKAITEREEGENKKWHNKREEKMNTIFTRNVVRRGVSARVFRSFCAKSNDLGTIPVNIMKNGEDPPVLPDEEYPEWVFQLHEDLPSLQDLQDKIAKEGFEALSESEVKRAMKLAHRKEMEEARANRTSKF
jgi:hypothetical protein